MEYRSTLPQLDNRAHNKITANRKENSFWREVVMLAPSPYDKNRLKAIVTARFYGNGSRVYCCVWINPKVGASLGGGGFASGGGYHKPSAALQSALEAACVAVHYRERKDGFNATRGNPVDRKWRAGGLSGRGDSAIEGVMISLAKACGYPRARLHTSYA